jgi:ribose 5-phosphate isomerase RpiB
VLVLPAGFLKGVLTSQIVKTFLNTRFDGGRHLRRIGIIKQYENSSRSI